MAKTTDKGLLVFLCGKMGAGKSFKSKELADDLNAVLLSEDAWLAAHFPRLITTFDDYLRHASLIRPFVRTLVQDILATGTSVVMDFPANTAKQRAWYRDLAAGVGARHRLIYIEAENALCLRQIAKRRVEQPDRAAFDTEEVFHTVTGFFEEPDPSEGLEIDIVRRSGTG